LNAISELGGTEKIASELNVSLQHGLKGQDDADSRTSDFGNNVRELMKPKPWCSFLKE
jgi:hypothetical protein